MNDPSMQIAAPLSRTAQEVKQGVISIPWQNEHVYGNLLKYANFAYGGFSIKIEVEYDADHDFTDGRGQFTDDGDVEGAVPNPNYDGFRTFRYFVPDTTIDEHYRGLIEMNYVPIVAREMAERYVKEDALIAAGPERAGLSAYMVSAEACLEGVKLGSSCCGGIEVFWRDEDGYIDEMAWEEVGAAVYEAREKLAKLRGEK
jgi:hypothetical protein